MFDLWIRSFESLSRHSVSSSSLPLFDLQAGCTVIRERGLLDFDSEIHLGFHCGTYSARTHVNFLVVVKIMVSSNCWAEFSPYGHDLTLVNCVAAISPSELHVCCLTRNRDPSSAGAPRSGNGVAHISTELCQLFVFIFVALLLHP